MNSIQSPVIVLCLVCRLKSSRLPRKAFVEISGKGLLDRLVNRLRMAKTLSKIVLCTSTNPQDNELVEWAHFNGIDAFQGDENNVLSRLIAVAKREGADHVIRVTGDNLFTCPTNIDRMVRMHLEHDSEYTRTNSLPLGVTAEVLSRSMLYKLERDISDPNMTEYLMLFAYDPERYRCVVLKAPGHVNRPYYSITVDTPDDLQLVRRIYLNCSKNDGEPSTESVVAYLDSDPNYSSVKPDAPVRLPLGETIPYNEFVQMMEERETHACAKIEIK